MHSDPLHPAPHYHPSSTGEDIEILLDPTRKNQWQVEVALRLLRKGMAVRLITQRQQAADSICGAYKEYQTEGVGCKLSPRHPGIHSGDELDLAPEGDGGQDARGGPRRST